MKHGSGKKHITLNREINNFSRFASKAFLILDFVDVDTKKSKDKRDKDKVGKVLLKFLLKQLEKRISFNGLMKMHNLLFLIKCICLKSDSTLTPNWTVDRNKQQIHRKSNTILCLKYPNYIILIISFNNIFD